MQMHLATFSHKGRKGERQDLTHDYQLHCGVWAIKGCLRLSLFSGEIMDKACVFQSGRAYLLASTAILLAGAIAMAPPALASNECGPLAGYA
jgi:hypothetical protein